MSCEDRFWKHSEEANAEHVEDLSDEIRHKLALDESEPPEDWRTSKESWYLTKRIDRMAEAIGKFVDSRLTVPPAGFGAELEAIRGLRIRKIEERHPLAAIREKVNGSSNVPRPYVAIDIEAEDLLRTLVRHRLGYERRHWNIGRVLEAAAAAIVARSERGRVYLSRVLRCHVCGLEDEAVAWARSVIEAELEFVVEEATADAQEVPLVDLINMAGRLGILSGSAFEAAHRVRKAGNDTLHVMVGLWFTGAVFEDLQVVLRALGGERGQEST